VRGERISWGNIRSGSRKHAGNSAALIRELGERLAHSLAEAMVAGDPGNAESRFDLAIDVPETRSNTVGSGLTRQGLYRDMTDCLIVY
jgi:hypothetical protein